MFAYTRPLLDIRNGNMLPYFGYLTGIRFEKSYRHQFHDIFLLSNLGAFVNVLISLRDLLEASISYQIQE